MTNNCTHNSPGIYIMTCAPCVARLLKSLHSDGYKRSLSALIERDKGPEFIQQVRAEYKALRDEIEQIKNAT